MASTDYIPHMYFKFVILILKLFSLIDFVLLKTCYAADGGGSYPVRVSILAPSFIMLLNLGGFQTWLKTRVL